MSILLTVDNYLPDTPTHDQIYTPWRNAPNLYEALDDLVYFVEHHLPAGGDDECRLNIRLMELDNLLFNCKIQLSNQMARRACFPNMTAMVQYKSGGETDELFGILGLSSKEPQKVNRRV